MMEITIEMSRYEELIAKEALLEALARLTLGETYIESKDVLKIIGYEPCEECREKEEP